MLLKCTEGLKIALSMFMESIEEEDEFFSTRNANA